MATVRHPHPYSALDLPHPGRDARVFGALVVAALALDIDPKLPWLVGVVAAALFAVAGALRTVRARHELVMVRRSADRLIVDAPTSRDASELVRWRSAELTTRTQRDRLKHEVDRTVRMLDPGRLPSASPLRRPEARANRDLLARLADRLGDEQPVSARGVLLARSFLRDPAGPLYSDGTTRELARMLRRVLGALEP
jgi:hypothetical protein